MLYTIGPVETCSRPSIQFSKHIVTQHFQLLRHAAVCSQVEEEDEDRAAASPPPFAPAKLSSGDVVPTFWVQAVDRWGNSTGPTQDLPCNVVLSCDGLHTSPVTAAFDDAGIAKIKGKLHVQSKWYCWYIDCQIMTLYTAQGWAYQILDAEIYRMDAHLQLQLTHVLIALLTAIELRLAQIAIPRAAQGLP